ncbi:MAG: shikimate dehydrogenase, partial [Clostridia bacterium]|nr:shikimate dehydrogenase [Clostridia bacterium]
MLHYAVIGDPVSHSRSPEIYNALFEAYGVDADFSRLRVAAGELASLRSKVEGLSGFAVTMPHKRAI